MNHMTHPLNCADISIYSPEISKFCYIKKDRYRLHFNAKFLITKTLFESLSIAWINMFTILMISANMATLSYVKINNFWNKDYDVIASAHDVTKKTLSRDSNYIVDVVMWPKFGNCSISMREDIITSIF